MSKCHYSKFLCSSEDPRLVAYACRVKNAGGDNAGSHTPARAPIDAVTDSNVQVQRQHSRDGHEHGVRERNRHGVVQRRGTSQASIVLVRIVLEIQ